MAATKKPAASAAAKATEPTPEQPLVAPAAADLGAAQPVDEPGTAGPAEQQATEPTPEQPAVTPDGDDQLQETEPAGDDQAETPDEPETDTPEQADLLGYCPTRAVCFPYGQPVDAHHMQCVHGEAFASDPAGQ